MDRERLADLLHSVQRGACSIDEALDRLRTLPFEDLGFARVDHHRELCATASRRWSSAQGKTPEQIVAIAERLAAAGDNVLVTRLAPDAAAALVAGVAGFTYHAARAGRGPARARAAVAARRRPVLVVSRRHRRPAASPRKRRITAEMHGQRASSGSTTSASRASIACSASTSAWRTRAVLIVVAGMEGALPSVVGGLVDRPVIAVPTSIGYGASFGGLAALLAMLNSCAAGVVVVNIDNGFGAAAAATRINQRPR